MHEMPIARHAVGRRILAHRGYNNAVVDGHAAQAKRLEHWRRRSSDINVEALAARLAGGDPVDLVDKFWRAQAKVVVRDRLRAGHQAEREARRVHVPEPVDMLEPDQ